MTTAILPVRYEITNTGTTASNSELKQICSSVISEGGYDETSARIIARRTSELASISTTFLPLVSIRLTSGREGAVVLPSRYQVQPTTSQTYEVVLIKNATLTGASWGSTDSPNVQYDESATSYTGGTIVQQEYITSTVQAGASLDSGLVYNWDLQLGATISGTSDIYTVAVRTLSATPTGSAWASLTFFDITH